MPGAKTHAEIIDDLESLIGAADSNAAQLEGSEKEVEAVRQTLARIKRLKLEQLALNAQRQAMTQNLNAALKEGTDAAITLRSIARAKIGHRSELLVHFKMAPLRKRVRRTKYVVVAQHPGEEATAPAPAADGAASGVGPGAAP
ncbi:MAG TPA: hypothetical protein DD490_32100 [Acidobacteria bacterium]|nr:hypothetical protein [Acidobacteriota bacterium]